jgi:hypothetical protein
MLHGAVNFAIDERQRFALRELLTLVAEPMAVAPASAPVSKTVGEHAWLGVATPGRSGA